MKTFLTLLISIFILSCESKNRIDEKTILVYYQDGRTEELVIKEEVNSCCIYPEVKIYFHDNCLYRTHRETKYDANYQGCFRCGVKYFVLLNHYKNY